MACEVRIHTYMEPSLTDGNEYDFRFYIYVARKMQSDFSVGLDVIRINMITLHVVSAILVLFLVNWLNMGNDIATAVYHAFVVVCYLSPVLGAMLSDGWLGKFRLFCFFVQ